MTPETLNFNGDVVTFIGLVGITSTFIILVAAFRKFYKTETK